MAGRTKHNNLPTSRTHQPDRGYPRSTVQRLSRFTAPLRRHPRLTTTLALATATIVCALAILLPQHDGPATVDPRTRVLANYTACLLTGPGGITTQPASAVWAGMQQATATTNERVTNQPVIGAQSTSNAAAFINTLAVQQCKTIVAVGIAPTAAALARASAYPAIEFITVAAASAANATHNVTHIASAAPSILSHAITNELIKDFTERGSTSTPSG